MVFQLFCVSCSIGELLQMILSGLRLLFSCSSICSLIIEPFAIVLKCKRQGTLFLTLFSREDMIQYKNLYHICTAETFSTDLVSNVF